MDTSSFESEFIKFFKKVDTPVKKFILDRYTSKKYKEFFKSFLLTYGIYTFSSFPCQFSRGYTPFINSQKNNIFGLKAGITDLSKTQLPLKESEAEIARFLIKQFKSIPLSKFQNWSSENS